MIVFTGDRTPDDVEYPCAVCGQDIERCVCPECPDCGEHGNWDCYRDGHLVLTKRQIELITTAWESLQEGPF